MDELQKLRKYNGKSAEDFIKGFLRASKSKKKFYDLETKNSLIEVKTCEAINLDKRYKAYHMGRFGIKTDNHISLLLEGIITGKIPKYAFVLRIGKQRLFKLFDARELIIFNYEWNNISWVKIFYEGQENIRCRIKDFSKNK
jgi:hypothetical protein